MSLSYTAGETYSRHFRIKSERYSSAYCFSHFENFLLSQLDIISKKSFFHSISSSYYLQQHFVYDLFIYLFCVLGPQPQHMEVPRLGVQSELWLLAYTTATVTQDPSPICNLHHSSQKHWILNALSEARD